MAIHIAVHRPTNRQRPRPEDANYYFYLLCLAEEKREIVSILYPHTRYEGTLPTHAFTKIGVLYPPHAMREPCLTMPSLNKVELQ